MEGRLVSHIVTDWFRSVVRAGDDVYSRGINEFFQSVLESAEMDVSVCVFGSWIVIQWAAITLKL